MKTVRAKFQCNSIEINTWTKTAKLSAVCGAEGENKDFTEATPNGTLEIMIQGDVPASEFFKPGKEYYLDFTIAE
jgi:hypothetical protein